EYAAADPAFADLERAGRDCRAARVSIRAGENTLSAQAILNQLSGAGNDTGEISRAKNQLRRGFRPGAHSSGALEAVNGEAGCSVIQLKDGASVDGGACGIAGQSRKADGG